jgi:tetratricopeptide (TPR) repeat protein
MMRRLLITVIALGSAAAPAAAITEAEIAHRYRQVLGTLAAGNHATALAALADLEADATPNNEPGEVEQLFKSKLRTLRDVLDEQAEVLVPVIMLHHDGYLYYRDRKSPYLAAHSRQVVEELAVLYAKRAGTPAAKVTASRILTSLAGHLLDGSMTSSAVSDFNQALILDPRATGPLRSLGVLAEKSGRLEEAKTIFERLLSIAPNDYESRVRLALITARLGQPERAAVALSEAVASPQTPAWLAELAAQELARILADNDQTTRAIQVLHRALMRSPNSQRLLIQLSFLLERSGDRQRALEAAQRAASLPPSSEPTPRWRYNRWPQDELTEIRQALRETVAPRLQLLATALANSATGSAAQAAGGGA